MEPGVARVAVAVNMYQTVAVVQPENFSKRKFVSNNSTEKTTSRRIQT
jgi:hypothetical protein